MLKHKGLICCSKINALKLNLVKYKYVLIIFSVLVTLFVALSYLRFIQNKQMDHVANQLSAALNVARLEAVKRGVQVSVCPRADLKETACGTSGNWTQGWLVFQDTHHLLVNDPLPSGLTLTANTSIVIYNASGALSSTPLRMLIQPVKHCSIARMVTVSASGQLNIEQSRCS